MNKKTHKNKNNINNKFIHEFKITDKTVTTKPKVIESAKHFFKIFLSYYIQQNTKIDSTYNNINIDSFNLKESSNKKHYFIQVLTFPSINHPFTIFGTYNNKIVYIMLPIGGGIGQYSIRKLNKEINTMTVLEKLASYNLLKNTLLIRESNFITYGKKDYFKCMNIKYCNEKIYDFKKKNIYTPSIGDDIYKLSILNINTNLKNYFKLLKQNKFILAKEYLTKDNIDIKSKKSSKSKKTSKSKKNICLKNVFYNSKDIIGHLLIFIELYKCINEISNNI